MYIFKSFIIRDSLRVLIDSHVYCMFFLKKGYLNLNLKKFDFKVQQIALDSNRIENLKLKRFSTQDQVNEKISLNPFFTNLILYVKLKVK